MKCRSTTNKATRKTRFYIDGKRVSIAEFIRLNEQYRARDITRIETDTLVTATWDLIAKMSVPYMWGLR